MLESAEARLPCLLGIRVTYRSVRAAPKTGSHVTKNCFSVSSVIWGDLRTGGGKIELRVTQPGGE